MRIVAAAICLGCALFAGGVGYAQQTDIDLDRLLQDIQERSSQTDSQMGVRPGSPAALDMGSMVAQAAPASRDTDPALAPDAPSGDELIDELLGELEEPSAASMGKADDLDVLDMMDIEGDVAVDVDAAEAEVDMAVDAMEAPPAEIESAVEMSPEDLQKKAVELSEAEIVRLRANELEGQEHLEAGFEALSDKNYDLAVRSFDAALRQIPERPGNEASRESALWGHVEADVKIAQNLYDQHEYEAALLTVNRALGLVPDHGGAGRLEKKIRRELDKGPQVEYMESTVSRNEHIRALLLEGRDLFENGFYDEANRVFESIRLIDEYNKDAIRFQHRIADHKMTVAKLERKKTVAQMMYEVKARWNPPLETDIERPELDSDRPVITTSPEDEQLLEKMARIIIPSIQFRNANIIDVIEELRQESEKADPEGLGVNIVIPPLGPSRRTTAGGGAGNAGNAGTADPFGPEAFDDFGGPPRGPGDFGAPPGRGSAATGGFEDDFSSPAIDIGAVDEGGIESVPTITLTLRRISLLDALQIITEYADLTFNIENRIVFIRRKGDVGGPLETRVYPVQPSLLQVIAEDLSDGSGGGRSGGGGGGRSGGGGGGGGGGGDFIELQSDVQFTRQDVRAFFQEVGVPFPVGTAIAYNPSTSQIIVRNTPENLEIFERILPSFNRPPPQVEIEARFVEILQEDLEELGLEWILTDDWEIARDTSSSRFPAAQERVQIDAEANGITKGLRFLTAGPAGIGADSRDPTTAGSFAGDLLSFSSVLTNPEVNVVLHALDQKGASDLLSAPRITTRSGLSATIRVVQEIIYPTEFEAQAGADVTVTGASSGANIIPAIVIFPESFETREIGVILNVTPTVGPDNYTIDLTLIPEVAELVDWIQYGTDPFNIPQPVFASRNANTSIVIWDGQTVVIGGLINETLQNFEDKIPILGDIPFLGRLFRSEGERSVKRNLLIFVTARIVDPAGQPVNEAKAIATTSIADRDPLMPR